MDSKKYTWGAKDFTISQCAMCKHKYKDATCDAFPSGIPTIILSNEHDHKKEFPDDNGIRFEPLKG